LVWGILRAVGPLLNGNKLERWTIEDGTHSGSRNVVKKFTLNTVQNPQNQKSVYKREYFNAMNSVHFCSIMFSSN
jgi:hypothetical protein